MYNCKNLSQIALYVDHVWTDREIGRKIIIDRDRSQIALYVDYMLVVGPIRNRETYHHRPARTDKILKVLYRLRELIIVKCWVWHYNTKLHYSKYSIIFFILHWHNFVYENLFKIFLTQVLFKINTVKYHGFYCFFQLSF